MTQATRQSFITSQTIAVEHIRISSGRPFAEVRRKLEGTVPTLDTGIAEVLRSGAIRSARRITETTDQGCRSSVSAIMAPCCRLRAVDAMRCNMTSVIRLPPQ
jgi:hypothetical protein